MVLKKTAVIGSGKMGSGIFYYLISFDFNIVWICIDNEEADKQKKIFIKKINRKLKTGLINQNQFEDIHSKITITTDKTYLKDCDLIVESIFEDNRLKKELFIDIDNIVNDNCIFATNTSSIPLSEICPSDKRSDKFIGIHFFYPVAFKNLIEINTLSKTSELTLKKVVSFAQKIKKRHFVFDKDNSFLINKIFLQLQAGAADIADDKTVTVFQIDRIVKENLFPIGIFEFFDHVGIDIMLNSIENYIKDIKNKFNYISLLKLLKIKIEKDELGMKTKKGFYNYLNKEKLNIEINKEIYSEVLENLVNLYLDSVFEVYKKGICTKEELDFIITEYMGCDVGPFKFAEKINYNI